MNYIILDFKIFKYDALLGALIVDPGNEPICIQTWNKDAMRNFYESHSQDIWIGHNNLGYDNIILQTILKGKNPYKTSKDIVGGRRLTCTLPITSYDTMRGFYSLKATELVVGKNISETPIDFDLDRNLTEDEKKQIESYNRDDLYQTYENFVAQYDEFALRLDIIKEFDLSLDLLNISDTKLAAIVLNSNPIEGIENMKVPTTLPKNIKLNNQEVIDFYLNEDFRKEKSISIMLCGCEHKIASGGIHAALKKVHFDKALYFDVSGYYNLIMLNYNLLPRTMPKESQELYKHMYHEQLHLKKINPRKRAVYKIILLRVFGSMMNKHTDFYDPYHGSLVTIIGEIFLVDLLEKLEGKGICIQSNTDGIVFKPNDWNKKDEVIKIVEEWEERTGFVIKKEEINNLWQRDVNNYCFDDNGTPVTKGESVNSYGKNENPIWKQAWNAKEPEIIAKGIVDYLLYDITPEETVEKNKRNLCMFQYACKTMSYDYSQYEYTTPNGDAVKIKLQNINRAFASNDTDHVGTVIKYKNSNGKLRHTRVQSLPGNVFIYNNDIREPEVVDSLMSKIDYQYYVDRIYERCGEFVE